MITEGAILDIASRCDLYNCDYISAFADRVIGNWFDYQYFSDSDIHSGTNTYICP